MLIVHGERTNKQLQGTLSDNFSNSSSPSILFLLKMEKIYGLKTDIKYNHFPIKCLYVIKTTLYHKPRAQAKLGKNMTEWTALVRSRWPHRFFPSSYGKLFSKIRETCKALRISHTQNSLTAGGCQTFFFKVVTTTSHSKLGLSANNSCIDFRILYIGICNAKWIILNLHEVNVSSRHSIFQVWFAQNRCFQGHNTW